MLIIADSERQIFQKQSLCPLGIIWQWCGSLNYFISSTLRQRWSQHLFFSCPPSQRSNHPRLSQQTAGRKQMWAFSYPRDSRSIDRRLQDVEEKWCFQESSDENVAADQNANSILQCRHNWSRISSKTGTKKANLHRMTDGAWSSPFPHGCRGSGCDTCGIGPLWNV